MIIRPLGTLSTACVVIKCHIWHVEWISHLGEILREFTTLSDTDICAVIALRLKTERLRNGLSQVDVSQKTGISLRTYKRFETTGQGRIETLVAVFRVLGRLRLLEVLLPVPAIQPHSTLTAKVEQLRKRAQRSPRCRGSRTDAQ